MICTSSAVANQPEVGDTPARSNTRPLPSGWSDSSDENKMEDNNPGGGGGRGGGGWDTSSDEGPGRGGGAGGGGMREFERGSAENTRKALLQNDALLCEEQQLDEDPPDDINGTMAVDGRGHLPLRYVPGDPFANEEADVGAWARHFTYLSVVASKSLPPTGVEEGNKATLSLSGHTVTPGVITTDPPEPGDLVSDHGATEDPIAFGRQGAFNVTRVGRLATAATADSTAAPQGGLTLCVTSAGKQHDSSGGSLSKGAGVSTTTGGNTEEEEEQEELLVSHGVYEEYLAYDCRPPEEHDGEGSSALAKGASSSQRMGASGTVGGQRERSKAAAISGPSTPQVALREEIMDRLFDELWERLTPDLLLIADREGSEAIEPAESNGFRDSME